MNYEQWLDELAQELQITFESEQKQSVWREEMAKRLEKRLINDLLNNLDEKEKVEWDKKIATKDPLKVLDFLIKNKPELSIIIQASLHNFKAEVKDINQQILNEMGK